MTRQMFWRSGSVHEGRSTIDRKWWIIIGALGALGTTAYLLPGLANGRHIRGHHLAEVTDIPPAPNNADANSGGVPKSYSPPIATWQDVPLLALQGSSEIAADGEVRLFALQAAFERERNSAAAAQLQVVSLQEKLANLRETQEEVLVLREQLADAKEHARQTPELISAETEQKKRADNALFRVAALQEELSNLSTEVLKAKTTADVETVRAASAFAQLEAVQHQLAIATALPSHRTESQPGSKNDGIVDESLLDNPRDVHPAERASELSLPPKANQTLSIEQRQFPVRNIRPSRSPRAITDKPHQALLSTRVKPLARPANKTVAAPISTPDPDASRHTRLTHEPTNRNVRTVGKPPQQAGQPPRVLTQETRNQRDSGALSLPGDLLPDSKLW